MPWSWRTVAAIGLSGMMHGYVALDADGELLVPFRTWRNNITAEACAELTPLLDFAVPQRWSIAHLYQSILEGQPHVPRIAHLTTLAGLRPRSSPASAAMGVGEASGMFPIDAPAATGTRRGWRGSTPLSRRESSAGSSATSSPRSCPPERPAGTLTSRGREIARPGGCALGRHPALPARGRRGNRHGRHQRRSAAIGQCLRRHLRVRHDRPRAEPRPRPPRDRHRGHARWQARRDGPLPTTGRPTSTPGSPCSVRWAGPWGARCRSMSSTNGSCHWPRRVTRTPAGCCRSTTCRAST